MSKGIITDVAQTANKWNTLNIPQYCNMMKELYSSYKKEIENAKQNIKLKKGDKGPNVPSSFDVKAIMQEVNDSNRQSGAVVKSDEQSKNKNNRAQLNFYKEQANNGKTELTESPYINISNDNYMEH